MDTQVQKTDYAVFKQSIMLANQARLEKQENGKVSVICPKCQDHPKITISSHGERTTIRCKCGFVRSGEINF